MSLESQKKRHRVKKGIRTTKPWRVINAIEVSLALVVENRCIEVYYVDFVVIETLRVMDNAFYGEIYELRDSLVGKQKHWEEQHGKLLNRYKHLDSGIISKPEEMLTSDQDIQECLLRKASGDRRYYESLYYLTRRLFPKGYRVINAPQPFGEGKEYPLTAVANEDYFERYFQLRISGGIKEGEIVALLESRNADCIARKLEEYNNDGLLPSVIRHASYLAEKRNIICGDSFLNSIIKMGDWFPFSRYDRESYYSAVKIISLSIKSSNKTTQERLENLNSIICKSKALMYPIFILEGDLPLFVDDKDIHNGMLYRACANSIVSIISELAATDCLHNHPANDHLLRFWSTREPKAAQGWAKKN